MPRWRSNRVRGRGQFLNALLIAGVARAHCLAAVPMQSRDGRDRACSPPLRLIGKRTHIASLRDGYSHGSEQTLWHRLTYHGRTSDIVINYTLIAVLLAPQRGVDKRLSTPLSLSAVALQVLVWRIVPDCYIRGIAGLVLPRRFV